MGISGIKDGEHKKPAAGPTAGLVLLNRVLRYA
jgi:hypothetical protein